MWSKWRIIRNRKGYTDLPEFLASIGTGFLFLFVCLFVCLFFKWGPPRQIEVIQ